MRYLRITGPDMNNGEGCRITLWLPGCAHKCKGCHNEWTHNYNQGADFTEDTYVELLEKLTPSYISGLTISGGDPLYQSNNVLADLYEWITRIRTDMPDKTIWLYTGFNFEDLRGIQMEIAQMCDVIVDGPYIEELRDVSLPFRGSSNQRIIHIQQQMTKEEAKSKYIISEQNKNDMKKSIFKGIINGQEFDNVNDYNVRMNELMSAGQAIEASTSTQVVDTDEKGKACVKREEVAPVPDMIPVFGGTKYESVGAYLDDVVTDNGEENEKMLDNLERYLIDNHNLISEKLVKMDGHARKNYGRELSEILNVINKVQTSNEASIANIESKYEVLRAGADVLELLTTEYGNLIKEIDDLNNRTFTPETCNSDTACKVPDSEKVKELATALLHLLGVQ